ncbi:tRNA epoxyqueuosine(34) reductase QueG [Meiothermus sp. QL-1]|uniref:tRNA epoxyqueuosine(34) reductase QueG n=1 Tax=Meiothermus sp. QL-1 TaxID=2058095 RepID=UPI000E0BC634|nr:tRNA epoxyqueuosine(34) reductase QueG [Meiothermus sp. QL-1]RDI95714.1 tRNA epoxyqueuosine(34) reductase QueG [Meiothermus sp. QL-1]
MDPLVRLTQAAEERGLLAAWAPVELPPGVQARYQDWLAQGHQAGMAYLAEQAPTRLMPTRRFAWARSVLVLAASHAYPPPPKPFGGLRVGRVARYAWVRDYHHLLRPHLEALEGLAQSLGLEARGYVDTGPLSERSYAVLGGLGWVGRNAMLIRMGAGSYLTLAVLLTSAPLPEAPTPHPHRCGRCTRCLAGCPTGALLGDGTLDARLCISYWTIEHRGLVPLERWSGMGEWLFGCDVCQEVCPWNRRARTFWAGFTPEPELAYPDLRDFFTLSSRAFARKYAATAFLRPGRTRMARNALIVLSNLDHPELLPLARQAAGDVNPVVRATAAQALARHGLKAPLEPLLRDPEPQVAQLARGLLEALG